MTTTITGTNRDGCEVTYKFQVQQVSETVVYHRNGRRYYMTSDGRLRTPNSGKCGFSSPLLSGCTVEA